MSSASEKTLSWIVIGARNRITLPRTPQVKRINPRFSASERTRFAKSGEGAASRGRAPDVAVGARRAERG